MKFLTLKAKLTLIVILAVIGLAVLVSVCNYFLNPEGVDWDKWIGNTGILLGLTIIGMYGGETFYIDYLQNKAGGMYQEALSNYNVKRKEIDSQTIYFQQFLDIKYRQELRNARLKCLQSKDIPLASIVLKLDLKDVDKLATPCTLQVNGKTYKFKSYTKYQIKVIKNTLSGMARVKRIGKDYYLSSIAKSSGISDYQAAYAIRKEKILVVNLSRIIKVITFLGISAFLAALTPGEVMDGTDLAAWTTLFSRIMSIIGGFYTGMLTGNMANKEDVKMLQEKYRMIYEFQIAYSNEPEKFTKTDEEVEAEIEYEEYMKEQEPTPKIKNIGGEINAKTT